MSAALKDLFFLSAKIRIAEQLIQKEYNRQEMRCPVHLSIGQEIPAGVLGLALRQSDRMISTHRCHGHYIAKGGNLHSFYAELLGKSTGCSKGVGGSMHLSDTKIGFEASTAIVGNSIPVGVGLALASKLDLDSDNISVVCLGEAATETGVFAESINFAAVHNLPCLFFCENNKFSVYSGLAMRQPASRNLAIMSEAMGVKAVSLSSQNIGNLVDEVSRMIVECRKGAPRFIEVETYRMVEHCGPSEDDELGYRNPKEISYWRDNDPLVSCFNLAFDQQLRNFDEIKQTGILSEVVAEVESAYHLARSDPLSNPRNVVLQEFPDEDHHL